MSISSSAQKRFLIVCSSGGHLQEALLATEGVPMDRFIATFALPHLKSALANEKVYGLVDPNTSLLKYAVNAVQSVWILLRVKPDVVLTTGAGIALVCAVLGKSFGARLIVIETAACVSQPSRTGAFLHHFADLFIVQWPGLLRYYPKAVYGGALL